MNKAETELEQSLVRLNREPDYTLVTFTTLRDIENEDNKKVLIYILKGGRMFHEVIPPAIVNGKITYFDYSKVLLTDEQDVQNYIDKKILDYKKRPVNKENSEIIKLNTNPENYKIIPFKLEDRYKNFPQYVANVVKIYKKYKETINDINFRY
jgi:hypothetical protein